METTEKHKLVLSCCRIVRQVSERINAMAFAVATIKYDAPDAAMESALDVIGPYALALMDSEDGLGIENPEADEYERTYKALLQRKSPMTNVSP